MNNTSSDAYQPLKTMNTFFSQAESQVKAEDILQNDQERAIDFKKLLQKYRDRTEASIPYTIMQVEDVMFIDEKHVVALEYIFYNKQGNYSKIKKVKNHDSHGHNHAPKDQIGFEEYHKDGTKINPHSAFNELPIKYNDSKLDYINAHLMTDEQIRSQVMVEARRQSIQTGLGIKNSFKDVNNNLQAAIKKIHAVGHSHGDDDDHQHHHHKCFLKTKDGEDSVVEPIISLWKINKQGQLYQINEHSFEYFQEFEPTRDGKMKLQLSYDRKLVSLGLIDSTGGSKQIKVMAWNAKNLKKYDKDLKNLNMSLSKAHRGPMVEISFVNKCQTLMLVQKTGESRQKYHHYSFYDVESGDLLYQVDNNPESDLHNDDDGNMKFMGVLVQEKESYKDDPFNYEEEESEIEEDEGSDSGSGSQSSLQGGSVCSGSHHDENVSLGEVEEYEGGEEAGCMNLVYFFATDRCAEKPDKWVWSFVTINFDELLQDSSNDFIMSKANEKFDSFDAKAKDFFEIPKNWFVSDKGKQENWYAKIHLAANKHFTQFALLNDKKHVYLAFDNNVQYHPEDFTEYYTNLEMAKQHIPENSSASHGRNQLTKSFLFLVIRMAAEGTQTTCFIYKDCKKVIKFKHDHIYAAQDVIAQKIDMTQEEKENLEIEQMYILQSTTISIGDQEIILKTQVKEKTNEKKSSTPDCVVRKSITQRHSGHFPVFAYNIGLKKLIIQTCTGRQKQLIYELPSDQTFVSFIEYKNFEDIGFYPGNLRIEMCSNFTFLTHHKETNQMRVNFILVDPYYYDVQIAIFQSSKVFHDSKNKKHQDIMIKSIMYCTKKNKKDTDFEVKLLTQFNAFISQVVFKEEKNSELEDYETVVSGAVSQEEEFSDDESDEEVNTEYEQVPAILSKKGRIYYVTSYDGHCMVNEINPAHDEPNDHLTVFDTKSDKCKGFVCSGKYFYFIDSLNVIIKLQQNKDTRQFHELNQFFIKDKDKPHFKVSNYCELIISDKFLIHQSEIFYLQDKSPLMDGILDMEELSEIPDDKDSKLIKRYASGPFQMNGSEQFIVVYQYGQHHVFKMRIYQIPDSTSISLINDHEDMINFTTFMDNGNILMSVGHRFALFDSDGYFMDEIEFNHKEEEEANNAVNSSIVENPKNIPDHKRMTLLSMSRSNQYFLFVDNLTKKFEVYSIVNRNSKSSVLDGLVISKKQKSKSYQEVFDFVPIYEINMFECNLVKERLGLNDDEDGYIQLKEKINTEIINLKVTNNGNVILICEFHEEKGTSIEIWGSIYDQENEVKNFKQRVQFPDNAKKDIHEIIDSQEELLRNLLEIEQTQQNRLPKNFRDTEKINDLEEQIEDLNLRRHQIVASQIFGGLVLVQCGRFIKYSKLDESMFDDDIDSENHFVDMNIDFDKNVEIAKIWSTQVDHVLQIIAKDNFKNIFMIITWDFIKNIEISQMQQKCSPDQKPENYIVKGMNEKMNYYVNQYQIFDLEYNIPLQQSTNNNLMNQGLDERFPGQRKIYEDTSRSLSIDFAKILNFPLTRMDIQYWKNIIELGEKAEHINENTELVQFNKIFNGYSLFHYFASNVDVIEMIHKKFMAAKDDHQLTKQDMNMPLVILHPDDNGDTALEIALKKQRPKCFELMIDLLEDYQQFFLSKMMLNSFPQMICQSTDMIVKFLSTCTYKSPLMEEAKLIPWPDDLDEYVFACHTSIISPQIMIDELSQFIDMEKLAEEAKNEKVQQDALKLQRTMSVKQRRKELRPQILNKAKDNDSQIKRVSIEAIDFDWIFTGDNAKQFLMLLAYKARSKIYIQKSVRVFISLIWNKYQSEIVKKIFLPYCVYMATIMYLTGYHLGEFLEELDHDHPKDIASERIQIMIISVFCFIMLFFFGAIEFHQAKQSFMDYLMDYWNYFDFGSIVLNFMFIVMLNVNCITESNEHFSKEHIRLIAAVGCFILWVKLFYWMRLFKQTAYFITLITQTIIDIRIFFLMLMISLCAFGTFFAIINKNTPEYYQVPDGEAYHYVGQYIGQTAVDALIAMYLLSLGEFDMDGYKEGPNVAFAWFFFILATFVILVVFMNMLIAMMGETFGNVQLIQEETALLEQVQLIEDHIWLIDLEKEYEQKKYIIRLCPDISIQAKVVDLADEIQDLGSMITKRSDRSSQALVKKIDDLEKTNRQLLKTQQVKIMNIQQILEGMKMQKVKEAKE